MHEGTRTIANNSEYGTEESHAHFPPAATLWQWHCHLAQMQRWKTGLYKKHAIATSSD
jgi:hypothetical protein